MAEAVQCLESLRKMLALQREEYKEKLANGIKDEDVRGEHVGRCKALKWTIEKITEQITSINGGDDDENKPGRK